MIHIQCHNFASILDTQITAARNDLMIQILNNPQWFHWPLIDHTNCGHGLKWLIMPGQVAVFTVSLPSSPFPSSVGLHLANLANVVMKGV